MAYPFLVRSVRVGIVIAVLLPVVLAAAEPKVTAPISTDDVREIQRIVAAATRDPITSIHGVLSSEPVSGSAPRSSFHFAAEGTKVPSKSYERADLVWAVTSRKKQLPIQYELEKSARRWKIVRKQQMVD